MPGRHATQAEKVKALAQRRARAYAGKAPPTWVIQRSDMPVIGWEAMAAFKKYLLPWAGARAVFEAITAAVHQNLIHKYNRHAGGHIASPGRHIASQLPHHASERWAPGLQGAAAGAARAHPRCMPQAGAPLLSALSRALRQDSSLSGTGSLGCKRFLAVSSER